MKGQRGLWVIAAGVSAAIHVGKLPPALPALQLALDMTLVQAGFLVSLVQLAALSLGLAVGLAADALGLRRVMVTGLILLSTASLAGGWATDVVMLLVLRGVEGLGFLLAVTPAPSLIRRDVPAAQLSSRLGLWGAYMPLGTALSLLAGPLWIASQGWSAWWWLTASISGLMALALWLAVPADPARGSSLAAGPWRSRLGVTLSARGPWLVALAFAAYSAQWLSVMGFLPSLYAQAGLGPAAAGMATAGVAAVNILGNVAAGRWLQRGAAPQRLMQRAFIVMALCSVLMYAPVWPGDALAWSGPFAAALVFSSVGGLIPGTLFSQAVRLAPGPATVSTTVGWMQQWSSLGQFVGPPAVAWLVSQTGGWTWSWLPLAACGAAGWVLAWQIGRLPASAAPGAAP